MEYNDLKIAIKRRKKLEQRNQQYKEETVFEILQIGETLMAALPAEAVKVEDEVLKVKYPNIKKQSELFVMPANTVDFLFQIDKNTAVETETENLKNSVRQIIMRLHPANTFFGDGTQVTGYGRVDWFDFDSFGLDGMIYNLMFFTAVRGYLCTGTFHCEGREAIQWKPVFLKVLNSFEEMEVCDES